MVANITNASQDASSQTDGSGNISKFTIVTWNICNGRGGGLKLACWALDSLNDNSALLQETKLAEGKHTRWSKGYRVVASDATRNRQGVVALAWRDGRGDKVVGAKHNGILAHHGW